MRLIEIVYWKIILPVTCRLSKVRDGFAKRVKDIFLCLRKYKLTNTVNWFRVNIYIPYILILDYKSHQAYGSFKEWFIKNIYSPLIFPIYSFLDYNIYLLRKMDNDSFIKLALNNMFKIAGYPEININNVEDVYGEDWFNKMTMTTEQDAIFRYWFMKKGRKRNVFHSVKHAEKQYSWFHLAWSLRIEDE